MTAVFTACVALSLIAIAARRRSIALTAVTIQSLLLALIALWHSIDSGAASAPGIALLLRAGAVAMILGMAIRRTRETRLIRSESEPLVRVAIALTVVLVVPPLMPSIVAGAGAAAEQHAAVALVALGIVTALTRRATIMQLLGIIVAENGATALALTDGGAVPVVIELGVVFDLLLIAVVAIAFHARIFRSFGSSDTSQLSGLHD